MSWRSSCVGQGPIRHVDRELHGGIALSKSRTDFSHRQLSKHDRAGNAKRSSRFAECLLSKIECGLSFSPYRRAVPAKVHAYRGNRKMAGVPVDKLHAQLPLELTDAAAEFRGRDSADPACAGKSARFDHKCQQRQVIENDSHTPSRNRCKFGKKSRKNSE